MAIEALSECSERSVNFLEDKQDARCRRVLSDSGLNQESLQTTEPKGVKQDKPGWEEAGEVNWPQATLGHDWRAKAGGDICHWFNPQKP